MRHIINGQILLLITLGLSFNAWGQGGQAGRGAQAQNPATQQASPPQGMPAQQPGAPQATGGRGGRGAAGGTLGDFYTYDATAASGVPIPDVPPTETHQKITINGETLAYTARTGFMPLRNATTGQSEAHLFFTCYMKEGAGDASARPVIYFLGGAPGVAAAWQEFGGLGPKRMKWAADGTAGQPPYGWTDNANTLLSQADLVFVNPVGTALSRADQPSRASGFWNTATDIAALGEFVRSFINTYDRRNSPLFLAGEDFGTGRTAGLASYLSEHQIPVHGVMLLSMAPAADAVAGDEQYITLMPSMTMAAWFHKKLSPELNVLSAEQIADQARQFASREYLHALYRGDRMTPEERTKAIADLSRLTGLSKEFVVNNNLRIAPDRFTAELLRDQRRVLSNSDARVAGYAPPAGGRGGRGAPPGAGGASAIDFNQSILAAGFLQAYETYLRRELTFPGIPNAVFYLLGGGVGAFTSTANTDANLAGAFARNPNLHVFVRLNFFDLSAPFYAAEFTLAHLNVSPEVRAHNITVSHFEAGQMPYVDNKSLVRLRVDLAKFVNEATSPARQ